LSGNVSFLGTIPSGNGKYFLSRLRKLWAYSNQLTKGENIMKRFTVTTAILGVSLVAFWAIFQTSALFSPWTKSSNTPVQVYDATGEMLKAVHAGDNQLAVPVSGSDAAIAPVYDATGAMLEAINSNEKVTTLPAYDATGAMLDAINPDKKVLTVPAYDATGAMLDAINP
jgi:hypothetical protein